jgi:hypothetical protein
MTIKARMARGSRIGIKCLKDVGMTYVGDVKTVGVPEASTDEIDVSTLDSEGANKEFILGATDAGQLMIEGNYNATDVGQQKLYECSITKEAVEFVIEVAKRGEEKEAAKLTGKAFVQACRRIGDVGEGEIIAFSATLRITGSTVFTAGK